MNNIFPLHILNSSINSQLLVELKSGDTYNGILDGIDKFMNIKLSKVIFSSKDSTKF
jgi:U6 snRNA-associated Sm-like protein LSm4